MRKLFAAVLCLALMAATLGCAGAAEAGELQPVQKLEAETFGALTGQAKVNADYRSASGRGMVGYIDDPSSTVTFSLTAPMDGRYRVQVCSSSDTDCVNAAFRYYVNGNPDAAGTVAFAPYGWENWALYDLTVDLKAGENTLTFAHTGEEKAFAQLDYIQFYTCPLPAMILTLDGAPLDGFSPYVDSYDVRITGEELPRLICWRMMW